MKKMGRKEIIDYLSGIIYFLIGVIIFLIIRLLGVRLDGIYINIYFLMWFPIIAIKRKNQYKRIDVLRKVLNLSLEEISELADIGKYDLMDWKWDKAYISSRKLYLLEDKLESMYMIQFKQRFDFKEYKDNKKGSIQIKISE